MAFIEANKTVFLEGESPNLMVEFYFVTQTDIQEPNFKELSAARNWLRPFNLLKKNLYSSVRYKFLSFREKRIPWT